MRQKSQTRQTGAAKAIKDIRRATRKQYSAEEKIRIVLDGLRGEETIAELCRIEGIAQSIYYKWSKEFMEAGKRRLAGDTARAASTGEVPISDSGRNDTVYSRASNLVAIIPSIKRCAGNAQLIQGLFDWQMRPFNKADGLKLF